jgi:YidC/Oxa1 family membrane protein insertase
MLLTAPPPRPIDASAPAGDPGVISEESAALNLGEAEPLPPSATSAYAATPQTTEARAVAPAATVEPQVPEQKVRIELPLFTAELSNRGAGITSWTLAEFRETADPSSELVELVTGEDPYRTTFVTPFEELGLGDLSKETFEIVQHDNDQVVFAYAANDITVRKTFSFDAESYAFRVLLEVENGTTAEIAPRFRIDLPAHVREGSDFREIGLAAMQEGSAETTMLQSLGVKGFLGGLTGGSAERYVKYPAPTDWAAVQTTYFLTVIAADNPTHASVWLDAVVPGKGAVAELFFDETRIPSGSTYARELKAYMGPKEISRLEAFGSETARAIDLGWAWIEPLTKFFTTVLKALYAIIPNYGVAIIILTILVRVVTAPLTIKQMRSMERMRSLQPKMKEIQEKHADDRQKQSEETMALYRSEGVNPLGGCFPMLLQFPVFIGLFYSLRSTIQLRQSPFFGWIDDLASPEMLFEIPVLGLPVRALPILMGATMVAQQKITPMQADPAQARMMMTIMPIMMTFVFYTFPSGLVLYWMVSNILAIAHQLLIGRGLRN